MNIKERDVIKPQTSFMLYYAKKTTEDPYFIDNGYKIYKMKNHEISYSKKTLFKEVLPVQQVLSPMFPDPDTIGFNINPKRKNEHIIMRYNSTIIACYCERCKKPRKTHPQNKYGKARKV